MKCSRKERRLDKMTMQSYVAIAKNGQGRPKDPNAFFRKAAEALQGAVTFDWSITEEGWPNIRWVWCSYMLRDRTEWERYTLLSSYVKQLNVYQVIDYLEGKGIPVYRAKTNGGKGRNLEYITLDPNYNEAKEREYERIWKVWENTTRKAKDSLQKRLPGGHTIRFVCNGHEALGDGLSQIEECNEKGEEK